MNNRLIVAMSLFALMLLGALVIMLQDVRNKTNNIESRLSHLESVIKSESQVKYTERDVECLAKNIYYEAGNQDDVGKYAVGTVTLNRLKAGVWGDTVCKVVYSPAQFSWTLLKKLQKPDPEIYNHSREIAYKTLKGYRVYGLEKSLLYHADYIRNPNWADNKHRVGKIGVHIFYTKGKGSNLEI